MHKVLAEPTTVSLLLELEQSSWTFYSCSPMICMSTGLKQYFRVSSQGPCDCPLSYLVWSTERVPVLASILQYVCVCDPKVRCCPCKCQARGQANKQIIWHKVVSGSQWTCQNMNSKTEIVVAHATSQKHTDTFSCYTWATHHMVVPSPLYTWDN